MHRETGVTNHDGMRFRVIVRAGMLFALSAILLSGCGPSAAQQATSTAQALSTGTAQAGATSTAYTDATVSALMTSEAATQVQIQTDLKGAAFGVCYDGTGTDGAADYKSSATSKIVVYTSSDDIDQSLYVDPAWRAASVAEAQVAICIDTTDKDIQTCPYHDGYSIIRTSHSVKIRLIAVKTGRVLASQTFTGKSPDPCPSTYEFQEGTYEVSFSGDQPDAAVVQEWIKKRIHQ